MTPAMAAQLRRDAEKEKVRLARMERAGVAAQKRMGEQSYQTGTRRTNLFDAEQFIKSHEARQRTMESTFTTLYKPAAKPYWQNQGGVQAHKGRMCSGGPGCSMPSWAHDIPRALALNPELDAFLDEPEPAAAPAALAPAPTKPPPEPFDPMEAPDRFFRNFKQRVSVLRDDVYAPPPERPIVRPAVAPPKSEPRIQPAPQPQPQPRPEPEPEDDSSALYLTSLAYLAECGIEVPSWDNAAYEAEVDVGALDDALGELALNDTEAAAARLTEGLRIAAGLA